MISAMLFSLKKSKAFVLTYIYKQTGLFHSRLNFLVGVSSAREDGNVFNE